MVNRKMARDLSQLSVVSFVVFRPGIHFKEQQGGVSEYIA